MGSLRSTPGKAVWAAGAVALAALLASVALLAPSCGANNKSAGDRGGAAGTKTGTGKSNGNANGNGQGEGGEGEGESTSGGGTSGGSTSGGPSVRDHAVVLVIDDGFDTSHAVFKDKIAASYTIDCKVDDEDDRPGTSDLADADLKKKLIDEYKTPTSVCTIKEGITFKTAADYDTVLAKRDEWNAALRAKQLPLGSSDAAAAVMEVLSGSKSGALYHGTSTAGLIAYQNPKTKLVLVQFKLGKAGDSVIEPGDKCPTQLRIDQWVRLHQDEQVRDAFLNAPVDDTNRRLMEIVKEQKVTLANLSLGGLTRIGLQQQLAKDGCGNLNFTEQYRVEGKLRHEREVRRYNAGVYAEVPALTVQAAGNESIQVDDYDDANDCGAPEQELILVGAVDYDGARADFTNYGKCVNFYALGVNVIVPAPRDFLNISNGTSFAAPIVTRHLSLAYPPGATPRELVAGLAKEAEQGGRLPARTAPKELVFTELDAKIAAYSLRGAAARRAITGGRGARLFDLPTVRTRASPRPRPW